MQSEQQASRKKVAIIEPYVFDTVYGNRRYISTNFQYIDKNRFEPVLISPIEGIFLEEIVAHGGNWRIVPAPGAINRYGGAILDSSLIRRISAAAGLIF